MLASSVNSYGANEQGVYTILSTILKIVTQFNLTNIQK